MENVPFSVCASVVHVIFFFISLFFLSHTAAAAANAAAQPTYAMQCFQFAKIDTVKWKTVKSIFQMRVHTLGSEYSHFKLISNSTE